ncbi:hypothetical protein EN751_35690, partial [Mesorhizobium sp. M4A.F.Ca.ET.029.04.2.1]
MHDDNVIGEVPGSPLPALGDAQQTEPAGFAQRIANRGRPDAGAFTEGESAALYIVMSDCRQHGRCDRSVKEIGDRAGELGPDSL